jgi:hypothetical protein
MNRNLFVVRVHCLVGWGMGDRDQFTETRVIPVGMTFAQAEAIFTAELRKNHTSSCTGPGWHPTPPCKVTITARPDDDPELEIGRMRHLYWKTFAPTSTPLPLRWQ